MKVTIDLPLDAVENPRGYTPASINIRLSFPVASLLGSLTNPLLASQAIPRNVGSAHMQAAVWLLDQVAQAATVQSNPTNEREST